MTAEILALGEAMIEFVRQPQMQDGRPLYRQGYGGDTSNAIISAARQGAKTGYLTAVGGDPMGDELLALWTREGVSTDTVQIRPQDPTGVYFVQPRADGHSFSYARRGSAASLYGSDDLMVEAIAAAKVLHVSAISQAISPSMRAAVTRAAEIARANGTLVAYDTNLRLNLWSLEEARAEIADFAKLVDIIFPSDDECETLLGFSDPDKIADHFLSQGAKQVLVKRGAEGNLLALENERKIIAAHPTNAVDSTGAGDSYAGSYLAYLLDTQDPETAARRAAIVASGTVSGYGAVDPIPYRETVLDLDREKVMAD